MRFRVNAESSAGGAFGQIRSIRFHPQVKVCCGSVFAADELSMSVCYLQRGRSITTAELRISANSCHSVENRYVGPRNPVHKLTLDSQAPDLIFVLRPGTVGQVGKHDNNIEDRMYRPRLKPN